MGGFDDHGVIGDWMPPSPSPRNFFASMLDDDAGFRSIPGPEGEEKNDSIFLGGDEKILNEKDRERADDQTTKPIESSEQKTSSRGGLLERMAARAGFNAPRLKTESIRPADLSQNPEIRSPYLTIPPGLSPTTLLDSPVFLSNSLMENSIAHELYGDILQPSHVEFSPMSTTDDWDGDDLWHEDGSIEELDKASDLDREWQRRHDQFHTIGYRDGLIAGKEASAQVGFNIGFSESVFVGFNWGLVRGVTSALACLPNGLREGMVETQEKRNKFSHLYESVHSISTTDAQKMFYDDLSKKLVKHSDNAGPSSDKVDLHDQSSDLNLLDNYYGELQSLILESPAIKVHLKIDE